MSRAFKEFARPKHRVSPVCIFRRLRVKFLCKFLNARPYTMHLCSTSEKTVEKCSSELTNPLKVLEIMLHISIYDDRKLQKSLRINLIRRQFFDSSSPCIGTTISSTYLSLKKAVSLKWIRADCFVSAPPIIAC